MNEKVVGGVHWSFWLIGVVALLWNIGGVANYVMQVMSADALDSYREAERAIIDGCCQRRSNNASESAGRMPSEGR
jgi:hypothetical protein